MNTNHLRIGLRTFNRGYSERFHLFRITTYMSSDHDKPRQESNYVIECLGLILSIKWRPDGKAAA